MNRSLSYVSVLALSIACSSEAQDQDQVTPVEGTGTTGTTTTGLTSAQTTSTAPTTTTTGATGATSTAPTQTTTTATSTAPSTTTQTSTAPATDVTSTAESSTTEETSSTSADESSSTSAQSSDETSSDETSGGGGDQCVKGSTKGEEVLMIAESFVAASHEITRVIENLAKENGSLGQNEKYGDRSEPGTRLIGGGGTTITNQYTQYSGRDKVRYVLMDGGGNDCLQAADQQPASAVGAAEALFGEMAKSGVEKILYFFYPDPLPPIGNDSLKNCLDKMRPLMKQKCDELTAPKCYWLDLRDTWNGHSEYTQDGIHPTSAGSQATGRAIWEAMVENCIAQ